MVLKISNSFSSFDLIVGCPRWGGWKYSKNSCLSSGLLAYFLFDF